MHQYDFRCKQCHERFSLTFRTYADYDAAEIKCPACGSEEIHRLIGRITVKKPSRDYTRMDAGEMLSVLESGDSRQVGEMFQQVGGGDPRLGADYHHATERLLKGDKPEKIERDLSNTKPENPPKPPTSD
ncbi:MAG: hypothetical protein D6712_06035 [Chloroflexi bacterium]|nr:MAG: hypothetical protein D6712_06035 [Chloroflexota bacterium]